MKDHLTRRSSRRVTRAAELGVAAACRGGNGELSAPID